MKNLTLILGLFLLAAACCNKKDDCPAPAPVPTLVGSWTNDVATNRKPTFTADSIYWTGSSPDAYALKADSILILSPNNTFHAAFTFSVSANNDTLTLKECWFPTAPIVYWRVK